MDLTIDSFRAIANDTSVSDRKYVYFANGKEAESDKPIAKFTKLCFNTEESRPREFKRPEGADREQGSALMRSQLLTLVRDRLGGEDSAAFKEIETKLFGKLKNGQFDPEAAAKPLRKRDIKAVLTKMDLELARRTPGSADALALAKRLNAAGQFVVFEKTVDPAVKEMLAPKGGPIKSTKDLTNRVVGKKTVEDGVELSHDEMIRGVIRKLLCDEVSEEVSKGNAKTQFDLDIRRTSWFTLTDGHLYSCKNVEGGACLGEDELREKLMQQVTGDPKAKFGELSPRDRKLVQFVMALSNQKTLAAEANLGIENNLFENVTFLRGKPNAYFCGIEKTKEGGLKFSGSQMFGVKSVLDKAVIDDPKADIQASSIHLDPDKCYLVQSFEYEYTPEQLERIVNADWTQDMDLALLKPAKQEAHMLLHIG